MAQPARSRISAPFDFLYTRLIIGVANNGKKLLAMYFGSYLFFTVLFQFAEHRGPFKSLYWAIVTGFTVGYGDIYPNTTPGRFIAAVHIIISAYLLAVATAFILGRIVINHDRFSDAEQRMMFRYQASVITMLVAVLKHHGIEVPKEAEDCTAELRATTRTEPADTAGRD